MKRMILAAIIIAVALSAAFSQTGDARAQGLSGAMTAVNDDMNTLFYNPAGLAFLRKGYLSMETGMEADLGMGLLGSTAMPDVYVAYMGQVGVADYYTSDPFSGATSTFDFDVYHDSNPGFQAFADGKTGGNWASSPEAAKFEIYQDYYRARVTYDGLSALSPVVLKPRLLAGGPHWGIALTGDFAARPSLSAFNADSTSLSYTVDRKLGAVAGLGFNLGPIALGANAKYYSTSRYSISSYSFSDAVNGPPSTSFFQELLTAGGAGLSDGIFEVGVGVLVTLGTLNAGIYNDSILPFINEADFQASFGGDFGKALLATTSLGLSWMPTDDKFGKAKSPLVLMASIDLKDLGDEANRRLCAGFEAGFDAGAALAALARFGYTQRLPGSFETMADSFNVNQGYVTVGATAKLWLAKLDIACTWPMTVLGNLGLIGSQSSPYSATDRYASVAATMSLAL